MTQVPRFAILFLVLGSSVFLPMSGFGQTVGPLPQMTPEEWEVWKMEEDFWKFVRGGRVEDFRALWNDEFASWPCQTPGPELPPGAPDWVTEIRERDLNVTYELEPKLVVAFGDVAVTQYAARFTYDYGAGETEFGDIVWKYTHTWKRVEGEWKIIGGMCGVLRSGS